MDGLILLIAEGFDSEDRLELLVDYRLRLHPKVAIIRIGRVPIPAAQSGSELLPQVGQPLILVRSPVSLCRRVVKGQRFDHTIGLFLSQERLTLSLAN